VTELLDGNVLVALCLVGHAHHHRVRRWFTTSCETFATCSVTQGTLLRMHMRFAVETSAAAAWRTLDRITSHAKHVYWAQDLPYSEVPHRHLQGSKQVTDAWLAELSRRCDGRLVTLDAALASLHSDVATTVPA